MLIQIYSHFLTVAGNSLEKEEVMDTKCYPPPIGCIAKGKKKEGDKMHTHHLPIHHLYVTWYF